MWLIESYWSCRVNINKLGTIKPSSLSGRNIMVWGNVKSQS